MTRATFFICILLGCLFGCGSPSHESPPTFAKRHAESPPIRQSESEWDKQSDQSARSTNPDPDRKIIYTADISIVVEDFSPVANVLRNIVKKFDGFIAEENTNTQTEMARYGMWTVRIPVKNFDSFLEASDAIGITESRKQNAQDVSEEYVDIEARIANAKKLEARIINLLERPEDKIQHVIEVEKELARVRESIERMQGRLRYLSDKTELTTVTINVREVQAYHPPEEPSFKSRLMAAWTSSVDRSSRWLQDLAVSIVSNTFPILGWALTVTVGLILVRRHIRKTSAAMPASQ